MQSVDFTKCNLSAAVFDDCDLHNAIITNSNLEKADFRRAINFSIDPEKNNLKGALFSLHTVEGLLSKYNIKIE
jgi:uncharacterized protein YjbI with pentapeptide repeats